ncbi:MAG: phage major capsid protein [Pseudomonadota bacterium]
MANPNWGELATSTLALRRPMIGDAVSKSTVIIYEIKRRKRDRLVGGGRTILSPVMVGEENQNFQWYSGREALNVDGQEVLTSAEYPWKQYACAVSIAGDEMLKNSGKEQVFNMLTARTQHAEKTIKNQMAQSAHGDGTGSSGKEYGGIALHVGTAAGATVGGINSTTFTWWDNARTVGGAPTTANIYGNMHTTWMKVVRGTDKPNLIISDNTYYTIFVQSLHGQQRYTNDRLARAGFDNVMFMSAPVAPDGGLGGFAPVGMRFLNLDTLEMITHRGRNNAILGGPRRPLTEDSDTAIIAGMGNFANNNRMLNAVLTTT